MILFRRRLTIIATSAVTLSTFHSIWRTSIANATILSGSSFWGFRIVFID
jgi:hypothetical protein